MPFRSRFLPKRRVSGSAAPRGAGRSLPMRWIGVGSLLVAAVAILAGCGQQGACQSFSCTPNITNPQGPVALAESNLWWFVLIVSTVVFVGVVSTLLWSIVRFRARPGSPQPRQMAGNTTLEIAWTVVPAAVLFIVLLVTIYTMVGLAQPASANTITVTAVGHQWWWEFDYPNDHVVTADEMHIPVGSVVHIDLRSNNVIHSFWVPQLGGKTDVIPGHDNSMWLKATAAGQYRGECAEYCGTQHAHMDFVVIAQSPADYAAWVAGQQQNAATSQSGLAAQGAQMWKSSPCIGCHVIDGANQLNNPIGPNLTHFGSRVLIAGGVLDNTPTNLYSWIYDAQAVKSGVDMPSFTTLPQSEINALVAYLESLK